MTIRERVTQGDSLSMVLYGISFLSWAEAMSAEDLGVLQPWYMDDTEIMGTSRQKTKLLRSLM